MLLLISGHWFACLWVMVAELEPPEQTTWVDALHESLRSDDDGGSLAARFSIGYTSEEDAAVARAAHDAAAACDDDERACVRTADPPLAQVRSRAPRRCGARRRGARERFFCRVVPPCPPAYHTPRARLRGSHNDDVYMHMAVA